MRVEIIAMVAQMMTLMKVRVNIQLIIMKMTIFPMRNDEYSNGQNINNFDQSEIDGINCCHCGNEFIFGNV